MGFNILLYRIRKRQAPLMEAISEILHKAAYFDVPGLRYMMKPVYDEPAIGRIVSGLLLENFLFAGFQSQLLPMR